MITRDDSDIKLTDEVKQRVREGMADDQQPVSITTLRAALMDVIDAGCRHTDGFTHEWKLNAFEEDFANAQRCEFADAVAARIGELQGEPLLYDAALLAKLRDARAEYQRGYGDGWGDAMADHTEEQTLAREGKR
jgi:hypothetical protein